MLTMLRAYLLALPVLALVVWGTCVAAAAEPPKSPDPAAPLTVHVISGSKEYRSEESLKPFLAELEKRYRVSVTASWGADGGESLENLEALKDADVLLLFARRMKLPEEQMKLIRAHWEAGKAVVGVRTASHAFQEADNEALAKVLGGTHQSHGADVAFKVANKADQAEHPVLRGVGAMVSRKLYRRGDLAKDLVVLQTGDSGQETQPVTVVREHKGGRVFYTSLGVPEDFKEESFRRLLTNAIFWTGRRDPEGMAR
jgi:type 1 glutamine amidotransferase